MKFQPQMDTDRHGLMEILRSGVQLDTVFGGLPRGFLCFKVKNENGHLTPALSPFCYRKTWRGRHAPSVFLNHVADQLWPQARAVLRYTLRVEALPYPCLSGFIRG
jgi:hypothetical protein